MVTKARWISELWEKVARIGCKYQLSFTMYLYRAPLSRGLAQGATESAAILLNVGLFLERRSIKFHSVFQFGDGLGPPQSLRAPVNLCESSVKLLLYLDGVYVNNHCPSVFFLDTCPRILLVARGAGAVEKVGRGASIPQQHSELKSLEVRTAAWEVFMCLVLSSKPSSRHSLLRISMLD